MTAARRFGRLLRILSAVVLRPGMTPAELATEIGVSERTLRRDLHDLRRLGHAVLFTEGYELQGTLNLEGAAASPGGTLPLVYEEQLRLLRTEFSPDVADRVQAEVERTAPAALALVFERAIAGLALPGR